MEPPLQDRLKRAVAYAVEVRDGQAFQRATLGQELAEVAVCQGPGRCMGTDLMHFGEVACPFCTQYPPGRGTSGEELQIEVCRRMIVGN